MEDDARTKAAMAAYQDAMRRSQTWRAAVRAALAAADASPAEGFSTIIIPAPQWDQGRRDTICSDVQRQSDRGNQ